MARRVGFLVGYTLALWGLAAYPALRLWGLAALLQSFAAMVLCLIPAAATLAFACNAFARSAEQQLLVVLGGTGLRLFVVLGLGWLGYTWIPELQATSFWLWLSVFYLATLGLEIGLLLKGLGDGREEATPLRVTARP